MTVPLHYGFEFERSFKSSDVVARFQLYLVIINALFLHPSMLLILFKSKKTMNKGIFWGYVFTETGLIICDWCFFLVGISFAFPFAAILFGGPLHTFDVSIQMTVLAIGVVAEIPFFFYLQVSMHQNIIAELNPQWILPMRTRRVFVSTFAVVLIINVLGFAFCGRESHDPDIFYQYPELEWMRNQHGTFVVFGDFGEPGQFGTEIHILLFSLVVIGIPIFLVLFHSLISLHQTENRNQFTSSSRTHEMMRRMFRIFLLQMIGAFICCTFPLIIFACLTIIDTHEMFPDYAFTILRVGCQILFLLNPCQFCIVFITRSSYARKILNSIRETDSFFNSSLSNQHVRNRFINSIRNFLSSRFGAKCSTVKVI